METNTVVAEKAVRIPKAKVEVSGNVGSGDGILTFSFADGSTRILRMADLSAEMYARAAVHGLEQKFRDSYAGAKSADEAVGLFSKVQDHVYHPTEPSWNAGRESSGEPTEDSLDLLAAAVTAAYVTQGKTAPFADAKAYLGGLTKEDRAKFRAKPSVQAELLKAKLAKVQVKAAIGSDLD